MEILGTVTKSHVLSTPIQYQVLRLAKKLKLHNTQISESFLHPAIIQTVALPVACVCFNRAVVYEDTK